MPSQPIRLRRALAELALFFLLRTALPAVYAMSQIERREWNRPAIVQVQTVRTRNRALYRRYALPSVPAFGYTTIL